MELKSFLLAKGEWLLLGLAIVGVALWLGLVASDAASLPKADQAMISQQQAYISQAEARKAPTPRTREPANSVAALQARLSTDLSTPPVLQWLTRHPNVYQSVPTDAFLYAYVALPTSVSVNDNTGSFQLSLALPQSSALGVANEDSRLGQGLAFEARREVPGSQGGQRVVNRMAPYAIQVQRRVGGAAWEPVQSIGTNGLLLASEAINGTIEAEMRDIQSMQDYLFRARVLYQGTGRLAEDEPKSVGKDIVVYAKAPPQPVDWATFGAKWKTLAPLAEVVRADTVGLPADARVFASQWSEEVGVVAKSDLRLALRSVSVDMQGKATARILMRKLLRDASGQALGWTGTEEFTVSEGGLLGEERVLTVPWGEGRKLPVDLRSDLELVSIQRDVPRILYYEARVARGETGQRVLEVRPKEKASDVVILRNRQTKAEMRLVRLERMFLRPGDITYPQYPEGGFEERALFEAADPSAFQPPTIKPDEPIWHEPGDGTLQRRDPLARTSQRWIEFKDGRYVYYDDVANNQIYVLAPPVSEPLDDPNHPGGEAAPEQP